jgi:hypothetical protein
MLPLSDIQQLGNVFRANDVAAAKRRAFVLSGYNFGDVVRQRHADGLLYGYDFQH